MKRFNKVLAIMMALVIMSISLIGCSADELSVFNAMIKSQSIKTMESKTDMTLKLDISGLPEEEMQQAQMLVQMLNNMSITLNQKTNQDIEKGIAKSEIAGNFKIAGMAMDFGLWVDSDFSGEKPVFKEIMKLPPVALMALPPEVGTKEYIVIDLADTMVESQEAVPNFKELMGMGKTIQEKAVEFLVNYSKKFNPGVNIIKSTGSKVINGVTLSTYQLKLDDAAAKVLANYIVTDFIKNQETRTLVKDFIISMVKSVETSTIPTTDTLSEIEKAFAEIEAGIPEFETQFNKFMDAFKDVKIFGDNGITINFSINNQGYIVNESGVIDLVIDAKSIQQALTKLDNSTITEVPEEVSAAVIKLSISFNSEISKINEPVEIKIPEITEANSADLFKIIQASMTPPEPVFPVDNEEGIKVYVNDTKVKFKETPVIDNGRTLAPAREVFESLGGEVLWNPDTLTVTSTVDDKVIIFAIGSSTAIIDGIPYELEVPAALINNKAYVPVRFLAESLDGEVHWDEANSIVLILK